MQFHKEDRRYRRGEELNMNIQRSGFLPSLWNRIVCACMTRKHRMQFHKEDRRYRRGEALNMNVQRSDPTCKRVIRPSWQDSLRVRRITGETLQAGVARAVNSRGTDQRLGSEAMARTGEASRPRNGNGMTIRSKMSRPMRSRPVRFSTITMFAPSRI